MKNDATNKMKLNIQMFADTADNDSDEEIKNDETSVNTENAGSEEKIEFTDGQPDNSGKNSDEDPKVKEEEKKITTKAFSERLKREKQKIEQTAEQKRLEEMDKIAIARGFKNWKELDEFTQNERLETLGIKDAGAFNAFVDDAISKNPVVLEAKRIIESQKEREQEAVLNDAINEINKIDSDIKTINDLIQLENYDEFYELIEKGYRLPDAYKIIAFDKLSSKRAASAAQNVITNIDSKGHLKTTTGAKTKEIVVPDEVLASYRKNMPTMTEQEIREHYAKFVGGNK